MLCVAKFEWTRRFQWCDIWITLVIVWLLSASQPFVFQGMCKLFVMTGIVESVTLPWVLGRNVGGIGAAACQNRTVIYPNQNSHLFVALKKWGMSDALATLWLTATASVKMLGPWSWTMSSLFRVHLISFTPLQTRCIGWVTWNSSLMCAAAVVAGFLIGIMSKRLWYRLSNEANFTLVS